jgi:hypothetical protein
MKTTTLRIVLIALVAVLALTMIGCKGESSPTAPPTTSTVPPGGTVTPPTGATINLTVSNATPLVSSSVVVTATVTSGGQPVVDGTAVQFTTTGGIFTDTGQNTTIRTTTGGVAKATLTSSTAGTDTITATVNNVSKTIQVTFSTQPVPPPLPLTAPTISSVCLANQVGCVAVGLPTGGQQLVITGTNFRAPVKVIFDPGNGQAPKEGFVSSITSTQINVVTPAFDIITGQQLPVTITVIDEAGTTNEQSVSKPAAFTYQLAVLTPVIRGVSPTSGPIDGGTRVSIFGDAFQAPVQVFFGAAEAQVIKVTFNEIDVMSPTARDTAPNASGPVTGPVDIRVLNVGSGKSVTAAAAFRYVAKMQITAITPNQGPFTGGTRFVIDGTGFTSPVTVFLAGIAAQVISVSGTEIVGISGGIAIGSCGDVTGPVIVTNVDNGDSATAPISWIYRVLKPVIIATSGTATAGGTATVTVANAVGTPRITIGTGTAAVAAQITGAVDNGNGTTTFTIQVPSNVPLSTQACGPQGAAGPVPTALDVTYLSLTTTCTDTLKQGLLVSPPATATLFVTPTQFAPFSATITPGNPSATPPTPPTVSQPPAQTITLVNTGAGPLTITGASTTCAQNSSAPNVINVVLPPTPQTLAECESVQVTARYNGSTTPGNAQCTVTITTDHGNKTFQLSGSSQ